MASRKRQARPTDFAHAQLAAHAAIFERRAHAIWAMECETLRAHEEFLVSVATSGALSVDASDATEVAQQTRATGTRSRSLGVLPLHGMLTPRLSWIEEILGMGTGVVSAQSQFRAMVADTNIDQILLAIDSPGGRVESIPEFSAEIYAAREIKPIHAIADAHAHSAAYWLGSSASTFSVTASGAVGSIGVYATHVDFSELYAQRGIKVELISAGKNKTNANEFEPLSADAREEIQERVNVIYDQFVSDVARNRGVTRSEVLRDFGQGRSFSAKDAKARGMVDRVESFSEALDRLGGSAAPRRSATSRSRRAMALAG